MAQFKEIQKRKRHFAIEALALFYCFPPFCLEVEIDDTTITFKLRSKLRATLRRNKSGSERLSV
jgi:hypothetical protein